MLPRVSKRLAAQAGRRFVSSIPQMQLQVTAPVITNVANDILNSTTVVRPTSERDGTFDSGFRYDVTVSNPVSDRDLFIWDAIENLDLFYECRRGSITNQTTTHGHQPEYRKWKRAKMKGTGYGQKWPKKR